MSDGMQLPRARLFGDDIRLREGVGLDLVPDGAGDLDLARGVDNIDQALRLRLLVRKGELAPLGWPDYGSRLHELIGEPNLARTHARLLAFAREAVEQDPRVEQVLQIQAEVPAGERDLVRLTLEVALIAEPHPSNLVIDIRLEQA
jgi:phage baseplate assembly protein W